MATVDNSRVVTVDPNFSLPPGVADFQYINPDDSTDPALERSETTGEVIAFEYDEIWLGDDSESNDDGDSNNPSTQLLPPDYVTVVSQIMRQTSDGRYVVDVILDVEDIPGVTGFEVGLTKT